MEGDQPGQVPAHGSDMRVCQAGKTLLSHEVMTPDPFCDPTPQDGLASSETAAVSVLLFFQGVEG